MSSKRRRATGQHMLIDRRVAQRQAEYAGLSEEDTVLEIGPGKGILTRVLAALAGKVVAIEKDEAFIPQLANLPKNVEVTIADALVYPLPHFDKVVSNLPYVISSPITFRLLELDFELGVLMYQKEFAERMCARVGDDQYSRLSVETFRRAECRILEEVPPSAFWPRPAVMSAIVELRPRPCPFPVAHPEVFSAVARALFSHRRKSVRNALRSEERALGEALGSEEGGREDSHYGEEAGRVNAQNGEEAGRVHAQHGEEAGWVHAQRGGEAGRGHAQRGEEAGRGHAQRGEEAGRGDVLKRLDDGDAVLKRRAESLAPEEIAELADKLCNG